MSLDVMIVVLCVSKLCRKTADCRLRALTAQGLFVAGQTRIINEDE